MYILPDLGLEYRLSTLVLLELAKVIFVLLKYIARNKPMACQTTKSREVDTNVKREEETHQMSGRKFIRICRI